MAPPPPPLLALPAQRAIRLVALALLDRAAAQRTRLDDGHDACALHDFRVAVRRLRSWLRIWRPELGDEVGRRHRRRLRRVARATSPARDAEVRLGWLREQRDLRGGARSAGLKWLEARLARESRDAMNVVRERAAPRFDRERPRLERALDHWTSRHDTRSPVSEPSFAQLASDRVRQRTTALREALDRLHGADEGSAAHDARIAAKRLRYLVEPLSGELADVVDPLLEALESLQDELGEVHDAQLFGERLLVLGEEAAAEQGRRETAGELLDDADAAAERRRLRRRDPQPGILAVAHRVGERGAQAGERATRWLGDGVAGVLRLAAAVVNALDVAAASGSDHTEIERKYLLRAFPERARSAPARDIAQGYLPGVRLVERLRRTDDGGQRRHFRTVKLGTGMTRVEIEEECSAELFDALWPLTDGRRLRKVRHLVPDGALTWEVDRFTDRDLVLAEVELATADQEITVPEWLQAVLIREVTGEDAYVNSNLAR